jgi:Domain of unknown function (DUF4347)
MTDVWCTGRDVAGTVCKDARLRKRGEKTVVTTDQVYGQAGWDVGVRFENCRDLAEKLKQLPLWGANRIAVNAHGAPGEFYINGQDQEALKLANCRDQSKFDGLKELHFRTASGGTILFVGCQMASGKAGSEVLERLSNDLFPQRRVVAFTTIGFDASGPDTQQRLTGSRSPFDDVCTEPGSRDTPFDNPGEGRDRGRYFTPNPSSGKSLWEDLDAMPWASESSKHAKTALNGKIIKGADLDPKTEATDFGAAAYLPGTWSVSIGNWQGYFGFSKDGTCYWAEQAPVKRFPGKWSADATGARWAYPSDAPNFARTFTIKVPLKSTVNGEVLVKGRNSGFFVMSKQT